MSTLGTAPVFKLHALRIPPAGGFWADVSLDGNALPAVGDRTTLTVGDLPCVGTVTQAGYDDHPTGGATPRVTLEGGAGWARPLARQGAYSAAGGVRLSTVLRDLAGLADEPYDAPAADVLLPPVYGWAVSTPREPVTGADVLSDLMTRGALPTWRVDPTTGRTRFDAWPAAGSADAAGRVMSRNLRAGLRVVGLDRRVAAFLPGATLEGVAIERLHLTETASKLEAEVYSPPAPALDSLREIVLRLFPFLGGFRLSAVSGGLRILSAATKALHLAGDAGDPAAARVGDFTVRLAFYPGIPGSVVPALWCSTSPSAPYTWVPVALTTGIGPFTTDAGTAVTIQTGSGKVTIG